MVIEYLKKMELYPKPHSKKSENEGLSLEIIENLESDLNNGNALPKAYKEFLFLGGEYNALGLDVNFVSEDDSPNNGEDIMACHRHINRFLKEQDINLLTRPYVILHLYDDDGFIFCYTDEGDNSTLR